MVGVICLIKVIAAIIILVLINMKELLHAKSKVKVMIIYFSVMAVSLLLGILISIDKAPSSPNEVVVNIVKYLGLEEK